MIRKFLAALLMLVTTSLYAQPSTQQPFTLVLDWFINPDHAPLLVAEQQGFFEKNGLQVKLVQPSDPSDGPKLVAAKKADAALTYQPQLLMQIDQGLPLLRFGSLVDSPLDCVVALKSTGIHKIADLKAKTIGYSAGGIDDVMLKTMLAKQNLNMKDVNFINVRYNLMQALLTGNISAFTGGMRNVEPVQLAQSGHPAQVFYPEEHGFPSYDELIFVTHRDLKQDPRLTQFLTALQEGIHYLVAHPQESWQGVIKKHPELNNEMNKASWFASIQYFSKNPFLLDQNKYQGFAQFMQSQGVIKKIPDLARYTIQLNPR